LLNPRHDWWRIALTIAQAHQRAHPTINSAQVTALVTAKAADAIRRASPAERWHGLSQVLMADHPAHGLRVWRMAGLLAQLLPEVDGLFGVPQLSDAAEAIDVGEHQLAVLEQTARAQAPLAVRLAALAHKIGKAGTPREIWPSHHKHEQRAQAALDRWAEFFTLPPDALALARLVVDEADRVHRVSDMRAGPITAMLERLHAPTDPARFEQLLLVCTCDWAAHDGHTPGGYPKAPKLRRALAAYLAADVTGQDPDTAQHTRAEAIAHTLRGHTPSAQD
jgi:tRNA nucleotidyltransferase (CCA-adding enzyme)